MSSPPKITDSVTVEETEKLMPEGNVVHSVTKTETVNIPPRTTTATSPQQFPMSDLGSFMIRLDEDTKRAVYANPVRAYANPAVLGLAGFGLTTMVLQFHNFGWIGLGPVVWLGLIFGGLAQLVAGLQEFGTGNNFGYGAFSTYGAFWIAFALMLIGDHYGVYATSRSDKAVFLLAFTFYTFIMWVASFAITVAHCFVFGSLLLGLFFLDIAFFIIEPQKTPKPGAEETTYSIADSVHEGFKVTGGVCLVACALSAWYVMAAILYKDVFGCQVLPLGPAPKDVFQRKMAERKGKTSQNV